MGDYFELASVRPEAGGNDLSIRRGAQGTIHHQMVRSLETHGCFTINLESNVAHLCNTVWP